MGLVRVLIHDIANPVSQYEQDKHFTLENPWFSAVRYLMLPLDMHTGVVVSLRQTSQR